MRLVTNFIGRFYPILDKKNEFLATTVSTVFDENGSNQLEIRINVVGIL